MSRRRIVLICLTLPLIVFHSIEFGSAEATGDHGVMVLNGVLAATWLACVGWHLTAKDDR